jgi:hypothetical protein
MMCEWWRWVTGVHATPSVCVRVLSLPLVCGVVVVFLHVYCVSLLHFLFTLLYHPLSSA